MQEEKSAMASIDKKNITEPVIAVPEFAATLIGMAAAGRPDAVV